MVYGICDCNHFYASCEQLYRPDLRSKPVVVLSNNDGCIVALTEEAKQAGLKRGDPLFKVRDLVEKNHVAVFSSNYALYQNISDSVMASLREQVDGVQQYSIDESFFTVSEADQAWCEQLRNTMLQWTGMPVAIAVARTKTLAKAAEDWVKHKTMPAFYLDPAKEEELLRHTAINDVWGIGWRNAPKLQRAGVMTAWDYTQRDDLWIRKKFEINGLKTLLELRGQNVISVDEPPRQSMCSGISFGKALTTEAELIEAASCHCMTLAGKLHQHHMMATTITFNAFTDRFREDFIAPMGCCILDHPSSYAPLLVKATTRIIQAIWVPGRYKGCRIWATELVKEGDRQWLLDDEDEDRERMEKQDRMGVVVEEIHHRYGRSSIMVGATNLREKNSLMSQNSLSPHYTTRFSDLPQANKNPIPSLFESKT